MGNSSTKTARDPARSRPGSVYNGSSSDAPNQQPQTPSERRRESAHGSGGRASGRVGSRSGSRSDLAILQHFGLSERDPTQQEQRRETKQERDARRQEKEKIQRDKERQRSLKEESVDGGFLVTLGTYTGVEDYNKPMVRQLQIERRLAPFWQGLNDHKDSWTEGQLVAAARGLPIPAPDEIPPEMERTDSDASNVDTTTDEQIRNLTIPISSRSHSDRSELSANLSASHPAFSNSTPTSPAFASSPSGMALFRGRAKTLVSLTSASRSNSSLQLVPQEIQLPRDPTINGQPLEAYLYKDAQECPICFLYYPPYLNKTRCCDQPICSECFVQIKRPDPHPPEHHEDSSSPNAPAEPRSDNDEQLVCEPSACPYCAVPEFGVTYESPPFKRGLAYAGGMSSYAMASATSAMSSSTSLGSMGSRRRTISLSANDKTVVTTDRVRPDWAKKLADARALALRRSAAATALHNAAYVLGNTQNIDLRALSLGRRRRMQVGDGSSSAGLSEGMSLGAFLGRPELVADGERGGSRRSRVDDLEELMMMEAIRLSLAAEDERKKKDEKDAAKDSKKRAKEEAKEAKEAKKAEKAARKASNAGSLYDASANQSTSTWATTSMTRSTSNLGFASSVPTSSIQGKGKAPATSIMGFSPLDEPTSTLNRAATKEAEPSKTTDDAQRHLEKSRADLGQPSQPINLPVPGDGYSRGHTRQFSGTSSIASSAMDSPPNSYMNEGGFASSPSMGGLQLHDAEFTPGPAANNAGSSLEPMINFRSLAAMIGKEEKAAHQAEHNENLQSESEYDRLPNINEGDDNIDRPQGGRLSNCGSFSVASKTDGLARPEGSVHHAADQKTVGEVHITSTQSASHSITQ